MKSAIPKPSNTLRMPRRSSSHLSEPQICRIIESHIDGASNREIARREHIDRKTVGRIIASPEARQVVEDRVREYRAQFFGLAPDALAALRHTLRKEKDPDLAWKQLDSIGVIPSAEETAVVQPTQPYSPALVALCNAVLERSKLFNMKLPGPLQEAVDRAEHQTNPTDQSPEDETMT